MNTTHFAKKSTAWALIVALVNPAAMQPAFARDTDIFISAATTSATGEPNVLIVLDTSDSMNIPEAWQEYPGAYDSHVEYLWNDPTFISSIGCAGTCTAADQFTNALKNQKPPPDYTPGFLSQGYFSGVDATARAALKQTALTYANAEDPLDPISAGVDARSTWRNYGGGVTSIVAGIRTDNSWIYWLPTGTLEDDPRLRAPSFNRWRGHQASQGGTRGGITYPASTAFNANNKCGVSVDQLLPSTVYMPTFVDRNSGVWRNQQWQRWEPYLGLTAANGTSAALAYPSAITASTTQNGGTATATSGANVVYNNDFLGGAIIPPVPTVPPLAHPAGASRPKVDSAPIVSALNPRYFTTNTPGSQGQPIKTLVGPLPPAAWSSGNSYSGWGDLKADHGGYAHQSLINAFGTTTLSQLLNTTYGFSTAGTRCLADTANASAANARTCAWLGNSNATGTPAYYDFQARDLALTTNSTSTGGTPVTRVCGWNSANAASAAPNGGTLTPDGPDATGVTRQWRNTADNFCVTNTTASTPQPPAVPNYTAAPACAPANSGQTFTTLNYTGTCAWTNRQQIQFEGDPLTYFHGGTCGGATTCSGAGCVTPHCVISATTSIVHGQTLVNWRTDNNTAGCTRRGNAATTCNARNGGACVTGNYAPICNNRTALIGATVTPGTTTNYGTFNLAATTTDLAHDCKADEGASGPWMTNQQRNFTLAWAVTSAPDNSNRAAPYTGTSGNQTAPPALDMYAVNYLNWKFGAKSNSNPIGRKTRLQIAKDALTDLVTNTSSVRFGLEVFNKVPLADPGNVASEGGNIVAPVKRMGGSPLDPDFANRALLNAKIKGLVATATTPLTEALYEAYLYFAGRAPQFGTLTTPAASGNVSDSRDPTAICTATGPGTGCTAIGNYKSPMLSNPDVGPKGAVDPLDATLRLKGPATCQKNFVILITDGGPDRDISANAQVKALEWSGPPVSAKVATRTDIDSAGPSTTTKQFEVSAGVPYGPISPNDIATEGGYVWLDELAYFMNNADVSPGAPNTAAEVGPLTDAILKEQQSVRLYAVSFAGIDPPALKNAALKGGGAYEIANNSAELNKALAVILANIRAWNPTVASPSVPISAQNRSENASDVFLAFFKPDITQAWDGTVKRYRLGTTAAECGTGVLLCFTGKGTVTSGLFNIEQVDPLGGTIIDPTAQSYWTPTPDGGNPDKGGTGLQVIANATTPATRKVYTWLSNVSTSADLTAATNAVTEANSFTTTPANAGKISKAMLGLANTAATDTTALNLINFIRGGNGVGACADGDPATPCTTWRAWAHADVQHSRPAIVTYDSALVPDAEVPASLPTALPRTRAKTQYLYYLSNDGLLHTVDAATGREQWTFLVEEALPKLSALNADNQGEEIDIADGSPAVWVKDVNFDGLIDPAAGDKVYLFFGLRRGGRAYYGLDVTQKDQPQMLWKISNTAVCGPVSCAASTQFAELGQSWSTPAVGKIRSLGINTPALVFGGGYDPLQDAYPYVPNTTLPNNGDTMGRALFVINGATGALVQSFGKGQPGDMSLTSGTIEHSVPSDPAAINTDLDAQGFLDRVYIGDMGGNLWRFDINDSVTTAWKGKRLANLSSDTLAITDKRKIMFPPAVVKQNFGVAGRFDAIYVGTGDREHPTRAQNSTPPTPNDMIFMIKDPDWDVNAATSGTTWTVADLIVLPNNSAIGITAAQLTTKGGWARELDKDCTPDPTPGPTFGRVSCGEKVVNAPTVFFNKLRFGTYSPTTASSECVPGGEGRLNEIDALTGAFGTLNATQTSSSRDRFYSKFLSRGFPSTPAVIVVGDVIYLLGVADGPPQPLEIGRIGAATKIFWYMEPEL